jgi:anti-sigma factor RsiW
MRHRSIQRRLSPYLDGELVGRRRRRVESHLARCPDCGRVFRTLAIVVSRMPMLRRHPDGGLADRIVRRLKSEAD